MDQDSMFEDIINKRKESTSKQLFDMLLVSIKEDDELAKPKKNISQTSTVNENIIDNNSKISKHLERRLSNNNIYLKTENKKKAFKTRRQSQPDLKNNNFNVLQNQVKIENSKSQQNIQQIEKGEVIESKNNKEICLIQEDGEMLIDYLLRTNISLKERLMIILDISLGIKAMHSCNIAHTNISIDNIIKCKDCFKISNLEHSVNFSNPVPPKYNLAPSDCYAPEQYYKKEPVGLAVDIWNFGLIQFLLLTGNNPIDITIAGPNSKLIYDELMNNKLKFIEQLNGCIDKLIAYDHNYDWKTIKKIMQKLFTNCIKSSPRKRPGIQAIVDDLFHILDLMKI